MATSSNNEMKNHLERANGFQRFFLNDKVILGFITLNAIVIFIQGFYTKDPNADVLPISKVLLGIDNFISVLFIIEMVIKIQFFGLKGYMKVRWNQFDFILIILSIPSLIMLVFPLEEYVNVSFLLVFRVFRVFKFFRFIQFFPQVEHIFRSIQQALAASVMVLIGFFVVIFIMAIVSCFMYQQVAPDMFGDPLTAYYTTFQVFTIEGWNAIPDMVVQEGNLGSVAAFFTKIYFIALFILGGVFGLSIVNSIFVDAMVSDNNQELEEQTEAIEEHVESLHEQLKVILAKLEAIERKQNGDKADNEDA